MFFFYTKTRILDKGLFSRKYNHDFRTTHHMCKMSVTNTSHDHETVLRSTSNLSVT